MKIRLVNGEEKRSFEVPEWNLTAHGLTSKFVVVYRPLYSEVHPVPTTAFLTEFSDYLEPVVLCSETLVISGDFNLHIDDSTDSDARRFSEPLETLD